MSPIAVIRVCAKTASLPTVTAQEHVSRSCRLINHHD